MAATKTAPKTDAPAAPAADAAVTTKTVVDFAALVAQSVAVAIPTAAQKAAEKNPFTDAIAGMLLNGKSRTPEQTTANPEWKDDEESGARQIVVPGGVNDEHAKRAGRLLNQAGAVLGVTVRKNVVQGKNEDGATVTQITYWAVERQERPRKNA